jgi:hypothetical protein
MKFLVFIFLIFLGFIGYHLFTQTSENADKELGRILTDTDASELKKTFEEVVTREKKGAVASRTLPNPSSSEEALSQHDKLFKNFSQTVEKDEMEGLNLARSYFFNSELSSEVKTNVFEEILSSDISEENKKYLSREILKGPSNPSVELFEKALRNYTATLSPEDKREILNDLRAMYRRQEIRLILERFALDQGL